MQTRLSKILPWVALLGAVIMVGSFILVNSARAQLLVDQGETTAIVASALDKVAQLHPAAAEDAALQAAVQELGSGRYVASVWLVDANGKIVFSKGPTAFKGQVQERQTVDFKRIMASVPAGALNAEQTLLFTTAAAIQAEGEHNDIYRHQVRALHDASGNLVALVGVAYDVSGDVSTPDATWIGSVLALLAGFLLYWLSLPAWTYLDARRSGEPAWVWTIFVLLGNLVALIAYLLVKAAPRQTPAS